MNGSLEAQTRSNGYQTNWSETISVIVHNRPWEVCVCAIVPIICAISFRFLPLFDQAKKIKSKPVDIRIILSTKPSGKFYANEDNITSLDFSQVPPYKDDFNIETESPFPFYRHGHIRDRVYTATMAIQNLPFNDWILLDQNFAERMALKKSVIKQFGTEVMSCLPAGFDGCVELLELLVLYLPRRYPKSFTLSADGMEITNHVTNETFNLQPESFNRTDATLPNHPMYIAGRLIEDDISILTLPPDGDEYTLQAALFGFPAGFHIQKKMGLELTAIHGPVPTYEAKLKTAMNRFFKNVGPSRMVMRVNWGINDKLTLFVPDGGHLYDDDDNDEDQTADLDIDITQCQLRIERQVLRRLPRTRAIAFLTKTYVYPLTEIAKEPGFAAELGGLLRKLPQKFAFYKRKPVWGRIVCAYLDGMAEKYPAEGATEI